MAATGAGRRDAARAEVAIVLSVVGDGIPLIHNDGIPLICNGQEAGNDKRLAFFERDPIQWPEHPTAELYRRLFALERDTSCLGNGQGHSAEGRIFGTAAARQELMSSQGRRPPGRVGGQPGWAVWKAGQLVTALKHRTEIMAVVSTSASATGGPRQWTGHVIVCGLHGVGLRTVEQLHLSGVKVVVVDDDPDRRLVRALEGWDIPHLVGSSRLAETLHSAGLAGAIAVVCVESDDLHTLETALLARELRADVRVVVQLANKAVGRAVADVVGQGAVLDVAGLAAPSVVEACVASAAHELSVAGVDLLAVRTRASSSGTLRTLFGDLTPLAVEPGGPGAQDVALCPGRDLRVSAGDAVTVLGTQEELDAAGVVRGDRSGRRRSQPPVLRPGRAWPEGMKPTQAGTGMARYLIRLALSALERRLRIALGILLMLVLASATVLRLGYVEADGRRMSWLDALYFTVETIGTVGYGDFYFREQPPWLRIYAIGLMIFGAMLATVFFALLTNVLVSRRIEEQLGRRRVPGMSGHTVVIGVGAVGVGVVEGLLARGREVVVVERDETNRYLGQVRALGVPVVIGDATLADTLDAANVPGAGAVAVLTSDDLTNLETALAVRDRLAARWRGTPVVVRLFDRQLALTVERSFGFHHVRSTAALAAPWFVGAALGLDVLGTFYVADQPLLLGRLPVTPGSGLVGLAMQDLGASIRVIGIERAGDVGQGRLEHPPRRATTFQAGDQAYLVGPYEELLRVLRRDAAEPTPPGDEGYAAVLPVSAR